MTQIKTLIPRLWQSAVGWSWLMNFLRVANVLLLLPLLSHYLSKPDMGFHFVLTNLFLFVPLLDLGFLPAISRSISYAMAGARELKAEGIGDRQDSHDGPNFTLLWELMFTTRALYRILAAGVLVFMGAWGTLAVSRRIHETSNVEWAWLAWGLTLVGCVFEMYSGWWSAYLRGLNKVLLAARIMAVAYLLRLAVACALLLMGAGLMSVPLATIVSSAFQRYVSRHYAMRFLRSQPAPGTDRRRIAALLRILWPNSWKVGVHCLSNVLVPLSATLLCTEFMGLAANSQLGLSQQVIGVVNGMASVWVQVKWPIIGQYLMKEDFISPRLILRNRIWLQMASFAIMVTVAIALTPWLLQTIRTDKTALPTGWFVALAALAFMEAHTSSWATFVSLGNRLPFLPITVAANIASVILSWLLLLNTSLGYGALILGPLGISLMVTSWRWPIEGARVLGTTWWKLMFRREL